MTERNARVFGFGWPAEDLTFDSKVECEVCEVDQNGAPMLPMVTWSMTVLEALREHARLVADMLSPHSTTQLSFGGRGEGWHIRFEINLVEAMQVESALFELSSDAQFAADMHWAEMLQRSMDERNVKRERIAAAVRQPTPSPA